MQRRHESGFGRVLVRVTAIMTLGVCNFVLACTRTDTHSHDAAPTTSMKPSTRKAAGPELVAANATGVDAVPGRSGKSPPSPAPVSLATSTRAGAACVVPSPAEAPPPAAPASSCPTDPTGPPDLAWGAVTFADAPESPRVRIELAESDATRSRGLMYRTSLEQDQGMLFVFPEEQPRSFWMKNTCIPLDMLFIDRNGTIVGILENVPTLNRAPRGVPCPASYVLEVNAGWTREHGVFAGQRVTIER